jgi:hypothetical protein
MTGLVEAGRENPTIFFFHDLFLPNFTTPVIDRGLTTFRLNLGKWNKMELLLP